MNLLTDAVYPVAAVVALAAVLGGAWITAHTPRGWRGALLNALVIVLASLMVTLGVALVLNRQNGWYPTLGDLFPAGASAGDKVYGAQPGATATATAPSQSGSTTGGATTGPVLPPLPSPGQRLQTITVPTSQGHREWQATIVLPTNYFDPAHASDTYPVLFAGHGMPGSMAQWLQGLDIRALGDPVVAAGKVRPFIVVIPSLTPAGKDTECVYGPDGPDQLETWLTKDVPGWVSSHLRAEPGPESWAWIGFSAGGWCAAMATMLHPDTFGAAVVLSGYFRPLWVGKPQLDQAALDRLDLVKLAKSNPPPVILYVQASKAVEEDYRAATDFLDAVKPPTSATAFLDDTGGHATVRWRPHVPQALEWLGANLAGFKPA